MDFLIQRWRLSNFFRVRSYWSTWSDPVWIYERQRRKQNSSHRVTKSSTIDKICVLCCGHKQTWEQFIEPNGMHNISRYNIGKYYWYSIYIKFQRRRYSFSLLSMSVKCKFYLLCFHLQFPQTKLSTVRLCFFWNEA